MSEVVTNPENEARRVLRAITLPESVYVAMKNGARELTGRELAPFIRDALTHAMRPTQPLEKETEKEKGTAAEAVASGTGRVTGHRLRRGESLVRTSLLLDATMYEAAMAAADRAGKTFNRYVADAILGYLAATE